MCNGDSHCNFDRLDSLKNEQSQALVEICQLDDEAERCSLDEVILASWNADGLGLAKGVLVPGQTVVAESSQVLQCRLIVVDRQAARTKLPKLFGFGKMRFESQQLTHRGLRGRRFVRQLRPAKEKPPT